MTLRGRIRALTTGVAATVLLLLAIPITVLLQQTALQNAREDAVDRAQGVADYISADTTTASVLRDYVTRINDRDDKIAVAVTLADGTAIGAKLPEWGEEGPDTDSDGDGPGGGTDGDADDDGRYGQLRPTSDAQVQAVDDGQLVRITVAADAGSETVSAFVSDHAVQGLVMKRLLLLAGAAVVLLAAAAMSAEWVSRRLVRHLTLAAETADQLSEGDLAARVPDGGPEEVRHVGAALNRLAGRIDELLLAERETVADLSHRLRTPLTAVRLDVESLPDSEGKTELEEHVTQLERTLTAVIHAARRPQREGVSPRCDPMAVARERFDFWAPLAEDQGRHINLESSFEPTTPPTLVRSAAADLRAAVDALLENAIAHTSDGVAISVVLEQGDGGTVLFDVRDQGPGVPAAALRRGQSDQGSTGLGLDIARSCAEASGGHLELVDKDGWAGVRLVLGPA